MFPQLLTLAYPATKAICGEALWLPARHLTFLFSGLTSTYGRHWTLQKYSGVLPVSGWTSDDPHPGNSLQSLQPISKNGRQSSMRRRSMRTHIDSEAAIKSMLSYTTSAPSESVLNDVSPYSEHTRSINFAFVRPIRVQTLCF